MSLLPPASAGDPPGHFTAPVASGGRGAHPPVPLGRTSSLGWPCRRASCLLLRPIPPPLMPAIPALGSQEEPGAEWSPGSLLTPLPAAGWWLPARPCPAPRSAALLPRPPAGRSSFVIPVMVPLSAALEYGPFLNSPPAGVLQLSFYATAVFVDL